LSAGAISVTRGRDFGAPLPVLTSFLQLGRTMP
jgi:hypothetical protein